MAAAAGADGGTLVAMGESALLIMAMVRVDVD